MQHLPEGCLDAFVGVRDHQLDAAQAAPGELTQELRPEGLGLRRSDVHAEHFAPSSLLTAIATITATDTVRPLSRAPSRSWHRSRYRRPVAFDRRAQER